MKGRWRSWRYRPFLLGAYGGSRAVAVSMLRRTVYPLRTPAAVSPRMLIRRDSASLDSDSYWRASRQASNARNAEARSEVRS
jgi:hypothetical protein